MPEKKWNNWIFQIPPLQYIQAISGGGRRAMSDSPLYNITCDFILPHQPSEVGRTQSF